MTEDMTALLAEREEVRRQGLDLDARIKKIQDEKNREVLNMIASIEFDLNEFAREKGLTVKTDSRKDDFFCILGKVRVTFHNQYNASGTYISVNWDDTRAEFTGDIPPVKVMRAFITAILEEE